VTGLIFMLRSLGIAYNEVVVALLDEPRSSPNLQRFAWILSGATTLVVVLVAATPLSAWWFGDVSALSAPLEQLARTGLWLALLLPALTAMQSWYQGMILFGRKTRGIIESVVIYLLTSALIYGAGVIFGNTSGLYIGLIGLTASVLLQTAWLWWRSQPVLATLRERDKTQVVLATGPSSAN